LELAILNKTQYFEGPDALGPVRLARVVDGGLDDDRHARAGKLNDQSLMTPLQILIDGLAAHIPYFS
jgi:hypothetical protein